MEGVKKVNFYNTFIFIYIFIFLIRINIWLGKSILLASGHTDLR